MKPKPRQPQFNKLKKKRLRDHVLPEADTVMGGEDVPASHSRPTHSHSFQSETVLTKVSQKSKEIVKPVTHSKKQGKSDLRLSSTLMQMKFMQRSAANIEQEGSKLARKRTTVCNDKQGSIMTVYESSYANLEELKFGRRSYNGMNMATEKLMAEFEGYEEQEGEMEETYDEEADYAEEG